MCGIIGVLNTTNGSPADADRLHAGSEAIRHRGPDDHGSVESPNVAMAARRLSIVDLAHGHQPMCNEDGTVHIVYNGEVYNHAELRRELESHGHAFRTSADTEAILHGYEQWGREGLLKRLTGMFAFAIWDGNSRTLFVARDRMGMKPLYYAEHDGRFYFASEIRALLIHSEMPRRINLAALGVYMQLGFVTAPHTMFSGVRKLEPAHYLVVEDGAVSIHPYWALSYRTTHRGTEADIVDEFRERVRAAVDSHLMSDVPVGALLSGGVDSTATVAFMRRILGRPFHTVTVGFEGTDFDESEYAAESAREIGTEHHPVRFTGDSMANYPDIIRYLEEPFARPTHAALYYAFQTCHELGLKVVITGEGADELLGGYAWHQGGFFDRALSRLPASLGGALDRSARLRRTTQAARDLVRTVRGVSTKTHERYQNMIRIGRRDDNRVLSPDVRNALAAGGAQAILDSWAGLMPRSDDGSEYERVLWLQSRTRMTDYIVHTLDRMSMAHSVEARPPFLDHTLWEFCASIPVGLKLRHATEKYLLREAGRGLVPEAARVRTKAPLRVPYHAWAAQERLPEWAEHQLEADRLKQTGLFDPAGVQHARRAAQSGDLSHSSAVMSVLAMQLWSLTFLESPLDETAGRVSG